MDRIKKLKVWKKIALVLILLAVSAGIGFYLYVGTYYHAETQSYAATEETEDFLIYGERDSACGFILYPGGKVEECAYAPILSMLADSGVCCVVAKMPCHLAVFSPDAADRIMGQIPTVKHWYIGGHSLGGAMAADFAAENQERFSGLVLLAAYPTKELKTLPVLSVYGSEDGVLNSRKYKDSITYADAVTEYIIEGGNHAGFGNYGQQKGDGSAKITKEEQWRETVSYLLNFLRETGGMEEDVYSEIPIDFPFRQLGQSYSLMLASKETKEKTDFDRHQNLQLELYQDSSSERFCGIVYDWCITDDKEKRARMQGFTVNSAQEQKWAGADPFAVKTMYGEEGEPAVRVDYIYRDDGTLFYRDYWHDPMEFGTTLSLRDSFYDERGRVVYEKGYITHGKLEYYYIYADEGDKPEYCLIVDHNVGCAIANMIQYD